MTARINPKWLVRAGSVERTNEHHIELEMLRTAIGSIAEGSK
jgi:hypothetical protein